MYGSGSSSSMLGTSTRHGSVAPTPRWMLPQGNRRIGNNTNNSNSNSNTLPSVTTPSPVAVVKLASRTAPSWPWTPRRRTESVSTVLSLGEPTMAAAARDDEEEVTDGTSGHPPDEDDYDDDDPAERSRSSSSRMRLETAEDSMDSKMGGVDGFVVHDAGRLLAHSQSSSSSQQQTNNTTSTHLNILEWLQRDCPLDVIPLVLSFGGPQTAAAVSRTNRQWHAVVAREATWRGMCEGLYKWKQGDPEPESWFDLYRYSPCVPVDYPSIPKALTLALDPLAAVQQPLRRRTVPRHPQPQPQQHPQQMKTVRVLLRPGKYYLKQAIEVNALPGIIVSLETLEMPSGLFRPMRPQATAATSDAVEQAITYYNDDVPMQDSLASTTSVAAAKRGPSFFNLFSCNRQAPMDDSENEGTDFVAVEDWDTNLDPTHGGGGYGGHQSLRTMKQPKATLILRSRRANEPVFRVRQGVLNLRNLEIQHISHGLDIWNGNAAIQIQPPLDENHLAVIVEPRPTACLYKVHVTSKSGRGIVNIDGGKLKLRRCAVTDCAATGVYVGGPGSCATMEKTDVVRNGIGNPSRRGIARGHSGIYLEQGIATIHQSDVSQNTLTGISVVSPDNAVLTLEDSTLVGNGTYQLELPPLGSTSRRRSLVHNNTMALRGQAKSRSGLSRSSHSSLVAALELSSSTSSFSLDNSPQWMLARQQAQQQQAFEG